MDDDELEEMLRRARPDVAGTALATARALAVASTTPRARTADSWRKWLSPPRVFAPAAAAVLVLTGATTVTAYQLGIPPFQTLEPGIERVTTGVPVDYRLDTGRAVSCLAFVETRKASEAELRSIGDRLSSTDWNGYGQRTYDALPPADRASEQVPGPVADVVLADLKARALQAAPGVDVTGGAISCAYPSGDDGER